MSITSTENPPDTLDLATRAVEAANEIKLRPYRGDPEMREAVWALRRAAAEVERLAARQQRHGR